MARQWTWIVCALLAGCGAEDDAGGTSGGELLVGAHRAAETEARGVLLGGRRLVLEGVAGSVHVVGGPAGSPARLSFERVARGPSEGDAQRLLREVRIDESGDGSAYTFRMTAGGAEGAEVNVEGVVPRDASLTIRLGTGAVRVDTLEGDLAVSLDAGPVRATALAGPRVRVDAGAGSVTLDAATVAPGAHWAVRTLSGSVTLGLPPEASARVRAAARTGTVRVQDLEFENRRLDRRGTGMRFSGMLGTGDGAMNLATDVGTIRLRGTAGAGAARRRGP
jgi:hypothetical protein